MTAMSAAEKQEFLADVHVGVLSMSRENEGPLTVPVWYDYEPGGQVWFLTGRESRKMRHIEAGTRVSLCAQSEEVPYRYVMIEGPVVAVDDAHDEIRGMAVRYLGEEMGNQYAQGGSTDSVVVRVQPERWLGVDYAKSTG